MDPHVRFYTVLLMNGEMYGEDAPSGYAAALQAERRAEGRSSVRKVLDTEGRTVWPPSDAELKGRAHTR